ncbi:AAA family ATPase [Hyunsoonleella sp. SJ7]|uniref:AAA family ATPase n=1 Tax=Hyunsoonleella aquatilis TaxID=2762758 RepID=A0A923HI28_9FLAO|nr:AAA domain-containing protein [Hyunsoonleella aquatilis]MBC3759705.1 AAA family ATPase [Hyunsoonleella aquatilis]
MKIKNIQQYRSLYKTVIRDLPSRDENFIGNYLIEENSKKKKFGWFEIYHGDKEGYGKAEAGIENFLQSFLDMAKDGQAVYEFLQNAVDAESTHFTMIWDKDPIDGNYYLLVANNGNMFNGDSIRSILNVGSSTKTADSETIGKFGIGFKLAHRLVGKNNGLEELINENSGPILFSWKNYEIENLANAETLEPTEIEYNLNEKGNLNIKDDYPWLFKILITCFPCLPENDKIDELPIMANGALAEVNPFNNSEYKVLSRWVKKYRHILNRNTYNEGALFFIKLGSGKETELDEINLKEGVKFALAILKETTDEVEKTDNLLKTVQLKEEEPITYPELEYVKFTIDKNSEKDTYAYIRFGVQTYDELSAEQQNKLKEEANVEVLFGFRKHNLIEDYFKGAPNLYLYFPLSEEVHNFNYVLHSNAFYKGSSRTFLHKGSTNQDGINERLLETIVNKIDEELKRLSNSDIDSERRLFLHFYAALLTSGKSANQDRLWIEKPYINPINELLKRYIPVRESLNSNEFSVVSNPDEVFIKKTKIDVEPLTWGLENVKWFYWSDSGIQFELSAITKLNIKNFDLGKLFISNNQVFNYLNGWLKQENNLDTLLKELKNVPQEIVSNAIFKANFFETKLFKFNNYESLSPNEVQEKESEGYIITYNKLNNIKDILIKLKFNVTEHNFEDFDFNPKYFSLFNNKSQAGGYLNVTKLFSTVVKNENLNSLSVKEKHNIYEAFRTLNETPGDRIKELKLFKNNNNVPAHFKNLLAASQHNWLSRFCIHPEENNTAYKNYLIDTDQEIYEGVIYPFWKDILEHVSINQKESKEVFDEIIILYDKSNWQEKANYLLNTSKLIIYKGEVIHVDEIYFNEKLAHLSQDNFQNIQEVILKYYNVYIPDACMLSSMDKVPFSYNLANIDKDLEVEKINKTELHYLLLFSTKCELDFFEDNCIVQNNGEYTIESTNSKQQIFTSKTAIIKYVGTYYSDDYELIPNEFASFKANIELAESNLVEHLIEIFKEDNEDQELDLIELVLAERLQDKKALLETLTFTPLDAYWNNERSNNLYLKLLKEVVEGVIADDELETIQEKIKILKDESEIIIADIDSAQDSIEVKRGDKDIVLSQSQILNLENADSIEIIQQIHNDAISREILNHQTADKLFKISSAGVTNQLVSKFLENLNNKQITNSHQLAFVLLSQQFNSEKIKEFSIKFNNERWMKIENQLIIYSEKNEEFIDSMFMISQDYEGIQELLKLNDLEAFNYGNNEDDIIASKFLFVKGFNPEILVNEKELESKLNYLFNGWINLSSQIRVHKRKLDWIDYLSINPRENILKGIRTENEIPPKEFSHWAGEDINKIQFLSDLGFWKGENVIQGLRSYLLGELGSLSEEFSFDRVNNSLLLNTLKGLSGKFTRLNNNPIIINNEDTRRIELIEKIINHLISKEQDGIPRLVYHTIDSFKIVMSEENDFYYINEDVHSKLIDNEQNNLNRLYTSVNILKLPITGVDEFVRDFKELKYEKTFLSDINANEHNEPFYRNWRSENNIRLIKQDSIEFQILFDNDTEVFDLGVIEDGICNISVGESNQVVIYYKKSTSLEELSISLQDDKPELSDAIEDIIVRKNSMLSKIYEAYNAADKDGIESSHLKALQSVFKQEDLKHEREKLLESIKSDNKYSYSWFKSYLNLLLTFEDKQDTTQQKSIVFQEIKRYKFKDKISNKYFLLCGANSLIPINIEDFEDFSITLVQKNKRRVNIDVEGVSKRGQDLLIFCRTPIQQNIIDGFKEVLQVKISFSPVLHLLELLKNAFFNETNIDTWDNIKEKLPKLEFIYGPPGTGKTTTICKKVERIVQEKHDSKFLLLTPTNKAADVVCKKLIDNQHKYENEQAEIGDENVFRMPVSMVRVGRSTDVELEEYDENLYKESLDQDIIDNTHLIASTIHRIPYYDVFNQEANSSTKLFKLEEYWDYIIFDEASMTNLPYIVFAIMAIHKFNPEAKFIIAGDPKQIPPVVNVTDKELEEIDIQDENIYTMMGINSFNPHEQERDRREKDVIQNLTTQYRSVKSIGQLFSDLSYNNLLNHHREDVNHAAKELPENLKKLINKNVTFIDIPLDVDNSIFRIDKLFYSSYHTYSAILVAEIVKYFDTLLSDSESWSIGLIAPYKAQAVILNKLITSFGISDKIKIYSDTVHGFQGDECDIIFFIANPNNIRYTGHYKSLMSKEYIYNVAVSRAKDYLVILHPFEVISNNLFINQLRESYVRNFGENAIKNYQEFEEAIFKQPDFIENNCYITGHDNVNVFGQIEMKYFIKSNDNAIDIQLRKL